MLLGAESRGICGLIHASKRSFWMRGWKWAAAAVGRPEEAVRESRAGWSLSAGWGDDGGSGEQWGSGEQAHNVLGTLREEGAVGGARAHGSQTSGLSDEVGGNIIY